MPDSPKEICNIYKKQTNKTLDIRQTKYNLLKLQLAFRSNLDMFVCISETSPQELVGPSENVHTYCSITFCDTLLDLYIEPILSVYAKTCGCGSICVVLEPLTSR